ncbi:class F sortase [Subtercola sp. Z020]|uniref:class F sortase n=1 Tax=Subtercola sp. Z020 TaxID=2080582 RepID=UPI001E4B6EA2|nr:class F sortase [Subtercola sp. Z020]
MVAVVAADEVAVVGVAPAVAASVAVASAPVPELAPARDARFRRRRVRLPTAAGLVMAGVLALSACSGAGTGPGSGSVPLGTPMPPAAVTSPTLAPTLAPVTSPAPGGNGGSSPLLPGAAGPTPQAVPITGTDPAAQPTASVIPPTHLTVESVGIDMGVLPVGVEADGQMVLPEDSGQAGWYEYGPGPADRAGTTVIAAHVDSLVFGLGQFVKLRDVAAGATVTLGTADGAAHTYTVSQVTRTPKTDVDFGAVFDRTGAPRLVLVTCGGVFDRDTGHYLDNVIVVATPVA